ncbi:MAG: hypothetical protein NVS4B11_20990 [Ktedonobacteraceae bacterium]
MGMDAAVKPDDLLGQRSWRVVQPIEPGSPYAEHVVEGYQELVCPTHNNIKADHFIDRPERNDDGEVV